MRRRVMASQIVLVPRGDAQDIFVSQRVLLEMCGDLGFDDTRPRIQK